MADEREEEVGERAFLRLWERAADPVLKLRFKRATDAEECAWDIDLLKPRRRLPAGPPCPEAALAAALRDAPYLALAEAEMPVGLRRPRAIPDFLMARIIHAVPHRARGYGNRRLSDPANAQRLLDRLAAGGARFRPAAWIADPEAPARLAA